MKIKGVIEDLKLKKKKKHKNSKNDHSENIYRNFSAAVVASMGSVQFKIVP